MQDTIKKLQREERFREEDKAFERLTRLDADAYKAIPVEEIRSSGYVIHTLEASLWCILTTSGFREAVLKAVNLGDDADTTGAVTGALAGIIDGHETIPSTWLDALARKEDLIRLAEQLEEAPKKILPSNEAHQDPPTDFTNKTLSLQDILSKYQLFNEENDTPSKSNRLEH